MSVKYLLDKSPKDILNPFLIVCEGMGDVRFIGSLLEHIGINTCNVGCPSRDGLGGGSGFDSIPKFLFGIQAITAGKNTLRGILVIVDSDDKPANRFSAIQKALTDANFPSPTKPYTVEGDTFRVAIFLIPREGEQGTLEDLLLEAAIKRNPQINDCLDDFSDCTGEVSSWTPNRQAKMRLSALVAAYCRDNPWASDALMWSDKGNPIPIESDCFSHLADFLKTFTA